MEDLKRIIVEYWPRILEWAALVVSYFLVFLYKRYVASTKENLTVAVKERVSHIETVDKNLRDDYAEKFIQFEKDKSEMLVQYNKMCETCLALQTELEKAKKALYILTEMEVEINVENTIDET